MYAYGTKSLGIHLAHAWKKIGETMNESQQPVISGTVVWAVSR
jgi:hypothetical protein